MFEIKIKDFLGRIGVLDTPHGKIETPALLPVINPNRLLLPVSRMKEIGAEALITNAYIIYRTPHLRERAVDVGIHRLLGFDAPVMTDSGSYQLSVYGDIEVENEDIVQFQIEVGSDIIVPKDIPTPPFSPRDRAEKELMTTVRNVSEAWEMLAGLSNRPLLASPIQGSTYPDLREKCARMLRGMGDIFPIGAVVPLLENYRFKQIAEIILHSKMGTSTCTPIHLFGAGHPMILSFAVAFGCDLFDSAAYALFAKENRYLSPHGTYDLSSMEYLPCACPICSTHTAKELRESDERERLLAEHNLHTAFSEIRLIKESIREGTLIELVQQRCRAHPRLLDALKIALSHTDIIDELSPQRRSSPFYSGPESALMPEVRRHQKRLERLEVGKNCIIFTTHPASTHPELSLKDFDSVFILRAPFGPFPPELAETLPVNTVHVSGDLEAKHKALEGVVYLVKNNPDTLFTLVLDREWLDIAKQRLNGLDNVEVWGEENG
ncbi:tRNA guanosine(15) transglycosylase TgtA [Methanosarcinales archaeon]|nr:MAG: tRNA guanosine(15) transglycosylase TgtA [Methanosarcinales archaeon]